MMTSYRSNEFHLPVSISDLPGHAFSVSPETPTEKVVAELENQPALPGVLIIENGQLLGVITRLKLFERLGHRFGVELFLQKPIIQLKDLIRTNAQPMPGYSRIDEAIQCALSRPAMDVYDPIVVLREDGAMQLLDINSLLLAQSRAMASLSNVVGNLKQIDRLIGSGRDEHEIFNQILQLLRQVVPYHQAGILAIDETGMGFVAHFGYRLAPYRADGVLTSATYTLIAQHRQAICIPNAKKVPGWRGMEILGAPLAWMGVPLLANNQMLGLLSISRDVDRTFSSDERETALVFAQRITELLKRESKDFRDLNELQKTLAVGLWPAAKLATGQMYQENTQLDTILKSSLDEWLKYG
jgi:hypothetical protein